MPPKQKFTKDEIVRASVRVAREKGYPAMTARAIATELGASPKVIFGCFENMEALQKEVVEAVDQLYMQFIAEDFASGKYLPYKASGMAYIRFAKEETELFKLRFMRDRSNESFMDNCAALEPIIDMMQKNLGISRETAQELHLQVWIYVHGIASMIATNYLDFDLEEVSRLLTETYQGLLSRYTAKEVSNAGNHDS